MNSDTNRAPDISKVISVIMENPDIIEKISELVKGTEDSAPQKADAAVNSAPQLTGAPVTERRKMRSQLLYAIKPYVKKSRADAIDSVIAIADIVDMMRRK